MPLYSIPRPAPSPAGSGRINHHPPLDRAGAMRYNRGPLNEWDLCLAGEHQAWTRFVQRAHPVPYCTRESDRYNLLPPWIDMPPEAKRFNGLGLLPVTGNDTGLDIQLQVGGGASSLFLCDTGYDGIITELVLDIVAPAATGFTQASGDITWRVGVDRGQVPNLALWYFRGYGAVTVSTGSLTQPALIAGIGGLRIISGESVSIFVNIAAGAAAHLNPNANIIGSIAGYVYPR